MTSLNQTQGRTLQWGIVRWVAVALFVIGVIRTAWVAEDAFITFRTIDNFFNGYGLRWNVADRVQTYSHPLWMMALTVGRWITGEFYYSALVLGGVCSGLAVYLLGFKLSMSQRASACCLLILAFSKSFVDYSTSGLEGPLTHLLLAIFATLHFGKMPAKKRLFWMTLVASLGAVNRPDSVLLFLPAVVVACRRVTLGDCFKVTLLGGLPLVAWTAFATLYYGTPIPVTGYSKAMTGIDSRELVAQGFRFYADVATADPILLPTLCVGWFVAIFGRSVRGFSLAVGALLYCVYLLKIGGGYMSGRFLTPPFFVSVILVGRVVILEKRRWIYPVSAITALVLGLLSPATPILSGPGFSTRQEGLDLHGVVDERGTWYLRTGLLSESRDMPEPNSLPKLLGLNPDPSDPIIFLDSLVGIDGFLCGPGVHFVDPMLCDPFLMRLPAWDLADWKIGHFIRRVPDGYLQSVSSQENRFAHPGLAKAHGDICLITRGPLFTKKRFGAIWSLAFGEGKEALRKYAEVDYRQPPLVQVALGDFSEPHPEGTSIWNSGFHLVPDGGLQVSLGAVSHADQMELGLGGLAQYEVFFLGQGKPLGSVLDYAGMRGKLFPGIVKVELEVPVEAVRAGYDALIVRRRNRRRSGVHCVAYIQFQ
ncbi:MAG: hypothetical protein GY930_19710 [bacterium]|nr:hypothetical protein [bacterium]